MIDVVSQPDNIAGNVYDKYGTKNPIARHLMRGFLTAFDKLSELSGAQSAFEAGCGEGHLSLRLMGRGLVVRGCDIGEGKVEEANQASVALGAPDLFDVRSIYDLRPRDVDADLIICCEVLEHVPEPGKALDILMGLGARHLLLSVPREPIWRVLNMARGKYLSRLGDTPGHIQHWSSRGFMRFVSKRLDIVAVEKPLPWTMLLCRCA